MTRTVIRFREPMYVGAAAFLLLPLLSFGAAQDSVPEQNGTDNSVEANGTSEGAIVQAVERELRNAQGLDGEAIAVEMENGAVILGGQVANILAHDRAIRIAASVKYVQALEDNLTVRRSERPDIEVARDVAAAIALDPATEFWEINIEVEDGAVVLAGAVESFAEKMLAAKVAKGVRGVRSVVNNIYVVYEVERTERQIGHDVAEVLKWNTIVDSAAIEIDVEDGVVTLSGTVDSLYEKYTAERLARVAGVKAVEVSDLQVEWSAGDADQALVEQLSDSEITKVVRRTLLLNPRVSSFELTIEVKDGVVTLNGTVDNLKAKRTAAQAARDTLGVTAVRNQLTVEPEQAIADDELESNVEGALLRDPYLSGAEVDVAAVDGEVYLYGDTDSWFDKLEAGDVVARITGVTEVHNFLDVGYEIPDVYAFDDWDPIRYDFDFDFEHVRTKADSEIAKSIESELVWSPFVDADQVDVEVESGVATLTGEVEDARERTAATENAFEGGAYKVMNRLDVI